MQTLEQYIEEVRSLESFDSGGSYSIDLGRPLERLQPYGLLNPERYYLHLVAAAIARNSQMVEARTESRRAVFKFNRAVTFQELQHVVVSLFITQPDPAQASLRELGLGLASAFELGLGDITMSSWQPGIGRGARLRISDTRLKAAPLEQAPWEADQELTRIELRDPRAKRELFSRSSPPPREESWGRLHWAPVPVILNGSPVNRSLDFEPCSLFCMLGDPPWAPADATYRRLPPGEDFTGYLALGVPRPGGLAIVCDGVAYPSIELDVPGVEAVVYTGGLMHSNDLSELILDPRVESLVGQVQGKIRQLLREIGAEDVEQARLAVELLEGLALSTEEIAEQFADCPLFVRQDGSRATPADLLSEYDDQGVLVVAGSDPGPALRPYNPVLAEGSSAALLSRLVSEHLRFPPSFLQERYLAQISLSDPPGLVRLTERPADPPHLILLGEQPAESELPARGALPPGLEAALRAESSERAVAALKAALPRLYQELSAHDPEGPEEELVARHLLGLFRHLVEGGATLARIMTLPKLRELAQRLGLPGQQGTVSLAQLAEQPAPDTGRLELPEDQMESLRVILGDEPRA